MEFDRVSVGGSSSDMPIGGRSDRSNSRISESSSVVDSKADESEFIQLEKEILEQAKPRKPVARILPAFIDLIILGAQLGIFSGFLYMSYIFGNLRSTQCLADSWSETPLINSDVLGINVTNRFAIAIRWGFWMSTLNILRALLAQVALKIKNWVLLYASYVMFACNFTLIVILFIFMNMWRWDHPGRVCAGDFLTPAQKDDPAFKSTYLLVEGKFLQIILIIIYSILGLGCYSMCFVTIFLSQKKTRAELESEQGMFKTKQQPVYEVDIKKTSDAYDRSYSQGERDQESRNSLLKQ